MFVWINILSFSGLPNVLATSWKQSEQNSQCEKMAKQEWVQHMTSSGVHHLVYKGVGHALPVNVKPQ